MASARAEGAGARPRPAETGGERAGSVPPRRDEADREARAAGGPPPRAALGPDLAPLLLLLEAARAGLPRELSAQLTALLRELLLTLRALIDWYLERLERPDSGPAVEDIPIE